MDDGTPVMAAVRSPVPALTWMMVMCGLAVFAWVWRAEIKGSKEIQMPSQLWEHVRERFPLPPVLSEAPTLSAETLQVFIEANPFSPLRRYIPPPVSAPTAVEPVEETVVIRYKGRIQLGSRQRAVLEDVREGKTHFLEVGQAVAGYKVLDISEEQVILSDPLTNEEVTLSLTSKEKS